jgi:purine-binding chemotaxis protein CheW
MSENTSHQVVTFRVGDDEFAADIMAVERVLRYAQPTVVPNLPEWVEGVIEYEGRVIPVIDLARRFEVERREGATEASDGGATTRRVIVFAVGDDWIGAVVDSVLEVVVIPEDRLSPPPAIFRGLAAEYLRGLVRRADAKRGGSASGSSGSLLIYLEVERLLSATERLHLERAMADGALARGSREESSADGERDA